MKPQKVLNFRTHIGGLHGKTSFDSEKDHCEMFATTEGVVVKGLKGIPLTREGKLYELLVPYGNCIEILMEPAQKQEEELEKRGPGRPPGSKNV